MTEKGKTQQKAMKLQSSTVVIRKATRNWPEEEDFFSFFK